MSQLIVVTIIVLRDATVSSFYSSSNMATISNNDTTKNKPRLDHDGYSYTIDRSSKEKTYWRCIKYSSDHCRSRLHTCILTNGIVKSPSQHTCKVDGTKMELTVFNEHIANRAINTQETPETIITNCYKGTNA